MLPCSVAYSTIRGPTEFRRDAIVVHDPVSFDFRFRSACVCRSDGLKPFREPLPYAFPYIIYVFTYIITQFHRLIRFNVDGWVTHFALLLLAWCLSFVLLYFLSEKFKRLDNDPPNLHRVRTPR